MQPSPGLAEFKAMQAADPEYQRLLAYVDPEHASSADIRPEDLLA